MIFPNVAKVPVPEIIIAKAGDELILEMLT
jgi:hypothetical protein